MTRRAAGRVLATVVIGLVGTLLATVLAGCSGLGDAPGSPPTTRDTGTDASSTPTTGTAATRPADPREPGPLAGRVVVLDPGHQRGNGRFPDRIRRPVDAGGLRKECNTTGTSTDDGYPESTFVWEVAQQAARRLRRLGATVVLTRSSDSLRRWGPCIDERGRAGNPGTPGPTADVKVSLHADGVRDPGARGFHVIRPGVRRGWTDDIAADSAELARALRDALVDAGFATSTYRGRRGIDVRRDLGTLNLSDVPTVLAELGNMRDPGEAALMRSDGGPARYAQAVVAGIRTYLSA
ncbi:N-acetylmuramoyl-L-alanine amidase family protein [Nocardioides sp. SYSU DS0651]|uniref:N-acetylmuramoyl-L-alanine amidase family protein n=1 Tax=Nocardioides sp. SYSU DS0651 TaxID=3415955 RepID=UPI003F4B0919